MRKTTLRVTFGVAATVGASMAITVALFQGYGGREDQLALPAREANLPATKASSLAEKNRRFPPSKPFANAGFGATSWEEDWAATDADIPEEDVLAFSPDAPLDELLEWWYRHADERLRIAALEAIGARTHDPQAWDVLFEALGDPSVGIRRIALTLLAQTACCGQDSENLIWMSLQDADPGVSQLASVLLGELEQAALEVGE